MAREKKTSTKSATAKNARPAPGETNGRASARPTSSAPKTSPRRRGEPSPDDIRLRAFEIWRSRGGAPGSPEDDWRQAEHELSGKRG